MLGSTEIYLITEGKIMAEAVFFLSFLFRLVVHRRYR
ncbi:MAG: hypothetical protein UW81_C0020G0012 [Candidatus Giovannonibacteria bacterium GW2011_GWC2_44_9]|uniref:Uncharacterized protein n=1 Tax=Candidatus Giovannonibacteria bacterium GW2011_GWC2_44_9 TaxID=1618658 RepID=A0A0G1KIJ8_9BACT|nr:MAG: hypothetical protein UW81_C0020G0012 [Candidatus Giovannonibacteria bacterium GW2011_GWC2_44_9]